MRAIRALLIWGILISLVTAIGAAAEHNDSAATALAIVAAFLIASLAFTFGGKK